MQGLPWSDTRSKAHTNIASAISLHFKATEIPSVRKYPPWLRLVAFDRVQVPLHAIQSHPEQVVRSGAVLGDLAAKNDQHVALIDLQGNRGKSAAV